MNDLPLTVIGTVKTPLWVTSDVVTVTVMTGAVVPLDAMPVVNPVTCPVIVPTVALCAVVPS